MSKTERAAAILKVALADIQEFGRATIFAVATAVVGYSAFLALAYIIYRIGHYAMGRYPRVAADAGPVSDFLFGAGICLLVGFPVYIIVSWARKLPKRAEEKDE